ncbi:MAG: epoxide hydrolase, soluble (sEH) [Phylliscum demangeonii]|nr:MAG: epoxide hydrolase, soluble (sEH) [Phylliscum demangeonii]
MPGILRSSGGGLDTIDHGHQDRLTAVHYSPDGRRKVTGSSDHRLKVFELQYDGSWKLIDSWRGHDAAILDAKWTPPFAGAVLGSVAEDQTFKVWQEDRHAAAQSGQRFKCLFTMPSPSRTPYVSLDFTADAHQAVFVALLSRDGLLAVFEADEEESVRSWALLDQFEVCKPPPPPPGPGPSTRASGSGSGSGARIGSSDETSFRVAFDPNALPCWRACAAGVRENSLALVTAGAVGVGAAVRVWRSGADRRFELAADLSPFHQQALVRDVAWAPMNVRGWDVVATACKDGVVRVFDLRYPDPAPVASAALAAATRDREDDDDDDEEEDEEDEEDDEDVEDDEDAEDVLGGDHADGSADADADPDPGREDERAARRGGGGDHNNNGLTSPSLLPAPLALPPPPPSSHAPPSQSQSQSLPATYDGASHSTPSSLTSPRLGQTQAHAHLASSSSPRPSRTTTTTTATLGRLSSAATFSPSRASEHRAAASSFPTTATTTNRHAVRHLVHELASASARAYGGVSRLVWRSVVYDGLELMTSHDDGSTRVWKLFARDGAGGGRGKAGFELLEYAAIESWVGG